MEKSPLELKLESRGFLFGRSFSAKNRSLSAIDVIAFVFFAVNKGKSKNLVIY